MSALFVARRTRLISTGLCVRRNLQGSTNGAESLRACDWWKKPKDVYRTENPFVEDEAATSFANALLRAPSLPHGPPELGLRRIQLDRELPRMPESGDLFSRKHTRDLLGLLLHCMNLHAPPIEQLVTHTTHTQPVIDELAQWTQEEAALADKLRRSNRSPHAVIEGAQGIDAEGWPIYRVFSCNEDNFDCEINPTLDNKEAFYLYDAAGEESQMYVVQAHTVTATFSHSPHYWQRKTEADKWFFMSPWTLPELLAVAQEMGRESRIVRTLRDKENMQPQQLSEAVAERVRSGFCICGGSVRDIFNRDPLQVMDGQNVVLTKLHRSTLGILIVDRDGAIDGETCPQQSSLLFAYFSVFPFQPRHTWREFVSQRVASAALPMSDVRTLLSRRERPFVDSDEAKTRFEELAVDAICRGGSFHTRLAPIRSLRKRSRKQQDATTAVDAGNRDLQTRTTLDLELVDVQALYRMHEDLRTDVLTACVSLPSVEEQRADNTLSRLVIASPRSMRYTDRFPFVDCVDARDPRLSIRSDDGAPDRPAQSV